MYRFYFILFIVIAYFLGNISPSTIQGRMHGIDIKKEGSGNAGTTNTLRVLGKKAALITLIIDVGKGVAAILLGMLIVSPLCGMHCAVAVYLGHVWPLIFKFKGGKGVATAFGVIITVDWRLGLLCLAIFVVAVAITRYVSLGSILAAAAAPFIMIAINKYFVSFMAIISVLIIFKHRSNIVRLVNHNENKLSFHSKKE